MKKLISCLFILSISISFHINGQTHYAYDGTGKSRSERLAALTIAGIVNREQPRLFLKNVFETWSYQHTDEKWMQHFEDHESISFENINNIQTLITTFENELNGAILYDAQETYSNFPGQTILWQGEFAAMLGGLSDCVPVPVDKQAEWNYFADQNVTLQSFDGSAQMTMAANLTLDEWIWNQPTSEDRYMIMLNWGVENILPLCNPNSFFIREITDWAVSQKMFQVDIAGSEAGALDFYTLSDDKATLLEDLFYFFRQQNPDSLFHIYGWMQPEPLVQWFSSYGASFHESMQANLSWFHVFPTPAQMPQRASIVQPENLILEDKYYLIFISSEGDAGNWNFGFQGGAWQSSKRGQVPIGWGFNLHFFETFPYLSYYYNSTATENDGFVSVISPLGYTYGDLLPDSVLTSAKGVARSRVNDFKVNVAYAYKHYNGQGVSDFRGVTISNNYDLAKAVDFYGGVGIETTFLFEPDLNTQRAYDYTSSVFFNHVNDNTFYGNVTNLDNKASEILTLLKRRQKPFFYLAGYQRLVGENVSYNGTADISITELEYLVNQLESDPEIGYQIEVVTPEKFNLLLHASLDKNDIPYDPTILSSDLSEIDKISFYVDHKELVLDMPNQNTQVSHAYVYSLQGRNIPVDLVYASKRQLRYKTPLLQGGFYIFRVETSNGIQTFKFVK
jgi:hypothetical protein